MVNAVNPFFLEASGPAGGNRFCLLHRPVSGNVLGAIVYVHPFAEEMNKSRRMAALQARAFARAGYAVLQCDLLGCGDSSGEFSDATWDDWIDDVADAAAWVGRQFDVPLTLWGLRAGCLIAVEAARRKSLNCDFLFWQPTIAGKLVLQQFLRLGMAKEMLDGQAMGSTERFRSRLASGESVDIAGYSLSPGLANGLERATLFPMSIGRSTWLEVSTRQEANLLPATAAAIDRWKANGSTVSDLVVLGPPFWNTSEIEEAPALIDATLNGVVRNATVNCPA